MIEPRADLRHPDGTVVHVEVDVALRSRPVVDVVWPDEHGRRLRDQLL